VKIKTFWNNIHPGYKLAVMLGLLLMAYGQLAVNNQFYFFWESYLLGLELILTIISILIGAEIIIGIGFVKKKYRNRARTGMLIFGLFVTTSVTISIQTSEQLSIAKMELRTKKEVIDRVGQVKGFGWLFPAETTNSRTNGVEERTGKFELLVKGTKRYETYVVELYKRGTDDWEISTELKSR
jgi:hypothetical protein